MLYPAKTNDVQVEALTRTQTMGLPLIRTNPHRYRHHPRKKRSPQERLEKFRCQLGNLRTTGVACSLFKAGCPMCAEKCFSLYERRTKRLGKILNFLMGR
jgi:hypothetical protein